MKCVQTIFHNKTGLAEGDARQLCRAGKTVMGSVIRLTYFVNPLEKRFYLNHFLSRWIFPLLTVIEDQISQIFKKLLCKSFST